VLAKLIAGALSPIWVFVGVVGAVIGWVYQSFWAIPMGIFGAGIMIWFIWSCIREHKGFEKAFGPDWSDRISPEQVRRMIQKRWTWFLKMKESPETVWECELLTGQFLIQIGNSSVISGVGLTTMFLAWE